MANKLKDGVVGRKIYDYFLNYADSDAVPIDAKCLTPEAEINEQWQYRLTFEDGHVSDWLITFDTHDPEGPHDQVINIVSAECFNEVM